MKKQDDQHLVEYVLEQFQGTWSGKYPFYDVEYPSNIFNPPKWLAAKARVTKRDKKGRALNLIGMLIDITDRRLLEQRLLEQKALLDTVLNNIDSHVYMKDQDRRYLYANPSVAALFGHSPDDIVGKIDSDLMPQEAADRFAPLDRHVLDTGEKSCGEEMLNDTNGEMRYFWSTKLPIWKDGKVTSYVGISTDITEVIRMKEEFRKLANTDMLTGIDNRRSFFARAEIELKRAQRHGTRLAILVIDIDHFKQINDSQGHATGDCAIIAFAQASLKELRDIDLLGRLGGDEFAVLLPDTSLEGAIVVAERIRCAVEALRILGKKGEPLHMTSSIGGVMVGADITCVDDALAKADAALYRSKLQGRNRIEF
ncbi:MAG: diguanylate cyclase, partial [Methylobacter sp.]|nr:diguanylate cyclase [Methylobacter sp.]